MRLSRRAAAVAATLIAVAVYFVALWTRVTGRETGYDIYQYWLPNMLYALDCVRDGGSGLLWNPFQNAGQPSFGISSTGILYPLNLFFLVMDPHTAMLAQIAANFAIAGVGMYLLLRELGAGGAAALCGALAFELGSATVDNNLWTPQVGDAFVWVPAMLYCCERLLRRPTFGGIVGLGASIAIASLSGSPQTLFFTYQVIGLRLLYEFLTRLSLSPSRGAAAVVVGLVLGPLFAAVHLLPGIETAAASIRSGDLTLAELEGGLTYAGLLEAMTVRRDIFNPVLLIPFALACVSWLRPDTLRTAVFYAVAAWVSFSLAFGPESDLFLAYADLPLGSRFRSPLRFTWITSVCLAVLTGLGADAILRANGIVWRRVAAAICMAIAAGFFFAVTRNPRAVEWALVALIILGALMVGRAEGHVRIATVLVGAAVAVNVLGYGGPGLPGWLNAIATRQMSHRGILSDESVYAKYAATWGDLSTRMTDQDRMFLVRSNTNYALAPKIASLSRLPSIDDYDPQTSRSWAEYMVMLRSGRPLTSLKQHYYPPAEQFVPGGFRKALLDLAAVRYVVVDNTAPHHVDSVRPAFYPMAVSEDLQVEVYENRQALPRAFYVPRVRYVPDRAQILARLASGRHVPLQSALIDQPNPSGFEGQKETHAEGRAEIVLNMPEHVTVRVSASAPGFLHLADQYAAGWQATVNGEPTPILRANYTFRAVQVPSGDSVVEFRYRPASVGIGAVITTLTIIAVVIVARVQRARVPS